MERKTFYVSTPIYFPSDILHIGHAFSTTIADTLARYKRARGYEVLFHTGTDEHGQKIENNAKAKGLEPKEYVDGIVEKIISLWKLMDIDYDIYYRTTDEKHVKAVQKIFKKLYDKGDIYKDEYEGWYCTPCETFFTETQLNDGMCPDCNREVNKIKEESYFFRLSKYQKQIEELLSDDRYLRPRSRRNEMLKNFVEPGLEDIAVSRTSFKWGIPVDFDDNHIVYVWIDALTNYITALGYLSDDDSLFKKFWPANLHLVGKEIVRFHSIIWPALLLALGEELPEQLIGTGWLIFDGEKMSKSRGNVVDPVKLVDRYGVDAVRYFLLSESNYDSDTNYSSELLISKINSDLANDLGNLLSRTVGMIDSYFDSTLVYKESKTDFDDDLYKLMDETVKNVEKHMDNYDISKALNATWKLVRRANKYVDETKPWELSKDEDEQDKLSHVLYNLAEVLRYVAILVAAAMPNTPKKIAKQLNFSEELLSWDKLEFGLLDKKLEVKKGKAIFPRIDIKKELEELEASNSKEEEKIEEKIDEKLEEENSITIEDFAKLDLRVGTIKDCKKAENSDRLLVSQIEIDGKTRQIVSGVANFYTPEEMIGKDVVVVCNLKPVELRGNLSEGMILAASKGKKNLSIITTDKDDMNGGIVS